MEAKTKPSTWGQRLPCPCGQPGYLAMMNYDGWFRVECHAGNGCDNFGASDFRKNAVERWNEHVRSGANYQVPTSALLKAVPNCSPQAEAALVSGREEKST